MARKQKTRNHTNCRVEEFGLLSEKSIHYWPVRMVKARLFVHPATFGIQSRHRVRAALWRRTVSRARTRIQVPSLSCPVRQHIDIAEQFLIFATRPDTSGGYGRAQRWSGATE